jgi:phosphate acetyltransferase
VVGVVANRVRGFELDAIAAPNADPPIYALPEVDLLMAPTVGQVAAACDGVIIAGDDELLGREALHLTVAAMTLPNLIERIEDGAVLITPGDRADVLLATLFAHASKELPSPAGVVLTGAFPPGASALDTRE